MPTNTFFHLPEEKRRRLMEAAWQEFTRTSCAGASVNRIVEGAHIPRGSFYQYFADKEDLFCFLLGELRADFWASLAKSLCSSNGGLAAALLALFDSWFLRPSAPTASAARKQLLLLKNPRLDWQQVFFPGGVPALPRRIEALLPLSSLPEGSSCGETANVLAIALFIGICRQCLSAPEKAPVFRQKLSQLFRLIALSPLPSLEAG